jgi:tetratricopeptide (TPR) repeat protein
MSGAGTRLAQAMDRAAAAFSAGRGEEASGLCAAILREDPAHFFALHLSSVLALQASRWEEAVAFATRALAAQPRNADVLSNRGAALRRLGRFDEALADYDAALATNPGSPDARNNRGVALAALDRHEEAIAEYQRAVQALPAYAEALHNLGASLGALDRHEEAVQAYSRALAIAPGHARARFNRALSRLALGDYAHGFADYEARMLLPERRTGLRTSAAPRWNGEPLAGRSILLLAEQGFGDTLMFQRFARVLHERGARVVLEAQPSLAPLLQDVPYLDRVVAGDEPLPACDFHCPLGSLPAVLGATLAILTAQQPPLAAPRAHVERWSARLASLPRPRIGIAWSGGTGGADDPRAVPLAHWRTLLDLPVSFVSLQKEVRAADRAVLEAEPRIAHFGADVADFRDTAALATLVDAVVTIDTAAAHLAGAIARPQWIVLPFAADWRWLRARDDSPWYPHARLVCRQRAGDWDEVMQRVRAALAAHLAPR